MLLDTSVAIPLRDGDLAVAMRAAALTTAPYVSILTVAELEGGVYAKAELTAARKIALATMMTRLDVLPFDHRELAAYRIILNLCGFNRARVIDRLIAATALANRLPLATRNPKDFRDIPDLRLEEW